MPQDAETGTGKNPTEAGAPALSALAGGAPPVAVTLADVLTPRRPSKAFPLTTILGCVGLGTVIYFKAAPGPLRGVALTAVAGIAVVAAARLARGWVKASAPRQGFLLTFIGVPLLFGVVVAITFTPPTFQLIIIRATFILVACLLPAAMYYLFIVTRKGSLLNEFVANMGRLGVLMRVPVYGTDGDMRLETEIARARRVDSCLQKFEAAYGPIPEEVKTTITQHKDASSPTRVSLIKADVATVFVSEAAVPVLIATFLMALLWLVTLPPIAPDGAAPLLEVDRSATFHWRYALSPNVTPATAAFLGSYFFCLQMLFRRYVRRDLRPSAYVGVVYRMVICVIGVWAVDLLAPIVTDGEPEKQMKAAGFIIGVFPHLLLQLVGGVAKKLVPEAVLPSLQSQLPISDLDGLTVWHEARLEDEDIENVPNMATADLLDLMINTRFPADRLVDWMDQAILLTVLGPQAGNGALSARALLRARGIRTASGLGEAYWRALRQNQGAEFERMLDVDPVSQMRTIIDQIDTFPSMRMIRLWKGLQAVGPRSLAEDRSIAA
jgi:hypothetical protein